MKELKFRSYDISRDLMIYYTWEDIMTAVKATEYVYYLIPDNISDLIYMMEHKNFGGPMQYVGKADMNDQDIYEGDIIRKEQCTPDDPVYGYYGSIGAVVENENSMGWYIRSLDVGDQSFYDHMGINFSFDEIAVIGNIYENPDLIGDN